MTQKDKSKEELIEEIKLLKKRIAELETADTESKQQQQQQRRLATVVRDSNDAITLQDFEGRITAWNHGAELIYGYSAKEAFQMSIWHLTPPDKEAEQKEFIRRLMAGETVHSFETQRVTKDGRILDVWLTVTKVLDDMGKPIGIATTERDITERKKAEGEIRKLNKELEYKVKQRTDELTVANKILEAFSYSVAHDLRAPLRAIAGFANILSEDYRARLDDEGKRLIGVISDNVIKMGRLIHDLLALSHLSRKEMETTDIDMTELARSVCTELKNESFRDRAMEVSVKPLPAACADYTLTKQIFTNLISNAMKFTSHKDKALIEIGGYDKGQERVYYVKDNGAGFDMKYADKLFGVFQRLHAHDEFSGTGIGLAIVSSAVRRHGGTVWAEGEVDKGATFYFTLPKGG